MKSHEYAPQPPMGNVDAKSPRAQARGVHFSGGQHQKSQGDVPDIYDDKSIQSANEKVGFLLELLNKAKFERDDFLASISQFQIQKREQDSLLEEIGTKRMLEEHAFRKTLLRERDLFDRRLMKQRDAIRERNSLLVEMSVMLTSVAAKDPSIPVKEILEKAFRLVPAAKDASVQIYSDLQPEQLPSILAASEAITLFTDDIPQPQLNSLEQLLFRTSTTSNDKPIKLKKKKKSKSKRSKAAIGGKRFDPDGEGGEVDGAGEDSAEGGDDLDPDRADGGEGLGGNMDDVDEFEAADSFDEGMDIFNGAYNRLESSMSSVSMEDNYARALGVIRQDAEAAALAIEAYERERKEPEWGLDGMTLGSASLEGGESRDQLAGGDLIEQGSLFGHKVSVNGSGTGSGTGSGDIAADAGARVDSGGRGTGSGSVVAKEEMKSIQEESKTKSAGAKESKRKKKKRITKKKGVNSNPSSAESNGGGGAGRGDHIEEDYEDDEYEDVDDDEEGGGGISGGPSLDGITVVTAAGNEMQSSPRTFSQYEKLKIIQEIMAGHLPPGMSDTSGAGSPSKKYWWDIVVEGSLESSMK